MPCKEAGVELNDISWARSGWTRLAQETFYLYGRCPRYRWQIEISIDWRHLHDKKRTLLIKQKHPGPDEDWSLYWRGDIVISDLDQFRADFLINPETALALALL